MFLNDMGLLQTNAYINGEWVAADSEAVYAVSNPATGEAIAEVAKCATDETRRAVLAAQLAQQDWQKYTATERARLLRTWFNLIIQHKEDLAQLLTAEQGKPLAEARVEIEYGASYIEWFAEEAKRVYGDTIPQPSNDKRLVCIKQPIGVVACITPWNFPNAMLTRKIAPALAAGCAVVCKPANETPLSANALAELAGRAGIPPGVINVISGHTVDIGNELTSNPVVRKLTFTGSTPVGKHLIAQCAATVKRTSMELGGNAPFIVFQDADLEAAIQGVLASKYRNAGQTCVCTNRILVQEEIYDEFSERLIAAVKGGYQVGNGVDDNVNIGPLINRAAVEKISALVDDAIAKGATLKVGGSSPLGGSYFVPSVLTDVDSSMRVAREEIFGPVAPLLKFSTEQEAIAMANDTDFGLAAYFYSRDIGRVWRVSEALEYGIVGINEGAVSNAMAPFGGVKESGNGREGSKYGLDDYLEIKYLCMGGING